MKKQQTAVYYLVKEFSEILGPIQTQGMQDLFLAEAIHRAKKMFKEQIEDAYRQGQYDGDIIRKTDPEEYYAQTFKQ